MQRKLYNSLSARRRGMATLETVMSLPFLLGAFALIIAVAMASIRKSEAAIAARNIAWQDRTSGQGEVPFEFSGIASAGISPANAPPTHFTMPPPPVSTGQNATAESRNQILDGSWADPTAKMSEDQPTFVPHLPQMWKLLQGAGGSDPGDLISFLKSLSGDMANSSGGGMSMNVNLSQMKIPLSTDNFLAEMAGAVLQQLVGSMSGLGAGGHAAAGVMNTVLEAAGWVFCSLDPNHVMGEIGNILSKIGKEVSDAANSVAEGLNDLLSSAEFRNSSAAMLAAVCDANRGPLLPFVMASGLGQFGGLSDTMDQISNAADDFTDAAKNAGKEITGAFSDGIDELKKIGEKAAKVLKAAKVMEKLESMNVAAILTNMFGNLCDASKGIDNTNGGSPGGFDIGDLKELQSLAN